MIDEAVSPTRQLGLIALMRDLLAASTEDELYELIGTWSLDRLDTGRVSVTLRDDQTVRVLSVSGPSGRSAFQAGDIVPFSGTAVEAVVASGRTECWYPQRVTSPVAARLAGAGFHTIVCAPLRREGVIVGTFNLAFDTEDALTQEIVEAAEEIADVISVNLERLRLLAAIQDDLERTRANASTLSRLNQLAVELSGVTSERDLLDLVAADLAAIVPIDRISLATPVAGRDALRVTALLDGDADDTPIGTGFELPIDGSGNGLVYRTGRALAVPDLAASTFPEHRRLAESGLRSGLSVPVPVGGGVGAVLNAGASEAFHVDDDQLGAVEALAALAGANLERIRAQASADVRAKQLRTLIDDSPLLIMTVAADRRILRLSRYASERLGHDQEALADQPIDGLYVDDDRRRAADEVGELLASAPGAVSSWLARMVDGRGDQIWVRHTGRRLHAHGTDRDEARAMIVCEDVSELQALSAQLEHQASHDPLTGLMNRREFDRRLSEATASADGPVSLCFIDIDRFKLVNDTAGHQAGDELLVDVAAVLSDAIARDDTLARIGGDEFALMLMDCAAGDALRVAERLRRRVNGMVKSWNGRTFAISLSIGVATFDQEGDASTLVTEADAACYAAKSAGRNRVSLASATSATTQHRDGEWVQRVQDALQHGGLRLAAQPIAPLANGVDLANFEVLVRMVVGDDIVPAGVFIPPTERYGLVTDVDRWVVREVVTVLGQNPDLLSRLGFCTINLSAKSIENETFLDFLLDLLAEATVPPGNLIFEITETTALSQFATAVRFIESVSALGCRFALDDFGAGFSTYQYLRELPVHILKIDGSLVRDVAIDPVNREIVHSMAQVASAIGMQTVAEFVEDASTSALLRELGVDYAQGYGIGRPMMFGDYLDGVLRAD